MPEITIHGIPAFSDNYFWVICDNSSASAVVLDPGDAGPVVKYLQSQCFDLKAILITHRHYDHVDGIPELSAQYPQADVYGPVGERIPGVKYTLVEGDTINFSDYGFAAYELTFKVLDVPGHTEGHIAYYAANGIKSGGAPVLFCGDTMFAAGCGRLSGGTAEQLYYSLKKLAALPESTEVYCTHEYTLSNLSFARAVEPENKHIELREKKVREVRKNNQSSLPSNIKVELETNPFLRVGEPQVQAAVQKNIAQTLEGEAAVFAALRKWKDRF